MSIIQINIVWIVWQCWTIKLITQILQKVVSLLDWLQHYWTVGNNLNALGSVCVSHYLIFITFTTSSNVFLFNSISLFGHVTLNSRSPLFSLPTTKGFEFISSFLYIKLCVIKWAYLKGIGTCCNLSFFICKSSLQLNREKSWFSICHHWRKSFTIACYLNAHSHEFPKKPELLSHSCRTIFFNLEFWNSQESFENFVNPMICSTPNNFSLEENLLK